MNACCADLENREEGAGPRGGDVPEDVSVTHCRVCERRHYEVEVDPVELGVEGEGL